VLSATVLHVNPSSKCVLNRSSDLSELLLNPKQMLDLITRNLLDAFTVTVAVSDTDNTAIVWRAYAETLIGWAGNEAVVARSTALIISPEHRHAARKAFTVSLKRAPRKT
jgi:hypothetical protein